MISNKDEILVAHNLGLGDHFICNGLVNYLSQYYKVFLPVYHTSHHSNLETIDSLYSDNPNVSLVQLTDHNPAISIWHDPDSLPRYFENLCIPTIDVEMFKYKPSNIAWYRYFYEQFDLPYNFRYKYFSLPKVIPLENELYNTIVTNSDYKVIHNNSSANTCYPMNFEMSPNLEEIYVTESVTKNLLNWTKILKNAKEIHVADSSVFCLVDSIKDECKGDLYFHDIRSSSSPQYHCDLHQWNIIKYETKF